jgi:hypothetical protein
MDGEGSKAMPILYVLGGVVATLGLFALMGLAVWASHWLFGWRL